MSGFIESSRYRADRLFLPFSKRLSPDFAEAVEWFMAERKELMTMRRAAVMREAHRHWRHARQRGWHLSGDDHWTWTRCLRFAQAQERARRLDGFAAVEAAMRELVASGASRL